MPTVKDKDLYRFLLINLRYSLRRDNHLAPHSCVEDIKTYLPKIKDKVLKEHTTRQLFREIETALDAPELYGASYYKGILYDYAKLLTSNPKDLAEHTFVFNKQPVIYVSRFGFDKSKYPDYVFDISKVRFSQEETWLELKEYLEKFINN